MTEVKASKLQEKIIEDFGEDFQDGFLFLAPAEHFDSAILGLTRNAKSEVVVVYDKDLIMDNLTKDMSYEEAEEYFEYNIAGSYMGEKTPLYVTLLKNTTVCNQIM